MEKEPRFIFSDKRLMILNFAGSEGISELFQYRLELVSPERDLKFEDFVDKPFTVIIRNDKGEKRFISGIITHFEAAGFLPKRTIYHATLSPMQARMNIRRRLKVWQQKSVKDVVTEVLQEWSIPHDWNVKGGFGARDYCVQYRESDWDYCARLLEEEGYAYYFEHSEGSVKTIFIDHAGFPKIPGKKDKVAFNVPGEQAPTEEFVHDFLFGQQMRSTKVQLRDYNFKIPRTLDEGMTGEGRYEIFDYPGEHMEPKLGEAIAKVRLQEQQCEVKSGAGSSVCSRLIAGYKFTLGDEFVGMHPRKDFNREYVVRRLSQNGHQPQVLAEEGTADFLSYSNSFQVIPSDVVFRPPRITPRPVAPSALVARVTGPPNEEIWVDEYGRVKVWFFWDREKTPEGQRGAPLAQDEKNRCWVRVSHGWAGVGYGQFFLPRVGQEVLVSFIDGDPDRPLITGRVYNTEQVPPVQLKQHKAHSTIKTKTYPSELTGGYNGWNELLFVDDKDNELVKIRAQRDLEYEVLRDWNTLVKRDRKEEIKRDQTVHVTNASVHTGKTVFVEAREKMTLKCGASTIVLTPTSVSIDSPQISCCAAILNTIKGGFVKIN